MPPSVDPWNPGQSIEAEIAGEKAASLGRTGRRVESSLAHLRSCRPGAPECASRLEDAIRAVWYYFIQREACGMRDHREAIALYAIPGEVLARLGTVT